MNRFTRGQVCGLPDKEFRYLRTVHLLRLIVEGQAWLPALHVAAQLACLMADFVGLRRTVSEDSPVYLARISSSL